MRDGDRRWDHSGGGMAGGSMTLVTRRGTAAILLLLVAGCAKAPARPQRPPVPVTITTARRQPMPYTIIASGIVVPSQTAIVSPQVDGIITNVSFHEGQEVTAGQPLFQIEPHQYRAAYAASLAVLARDHA